MKDLGTVLEHGLIIFNDDTQQFDRLVQFDLADEGRCPRGHAVRVGDYFYFYSAAPHAIVRVKAVLADLKKQSSYEPITGSVSLKDVDTQKTVKLHNGSIRWNPHRKKFILIAVEQGGANSFLGEVWHSEADAVTGPWRAAKKILTHNRYSFYNPVHHDFLDEDNGRVIYFEGTYAETFSGNPAPTPRYDYNQIMYRLDLADPRLRLP
jgi:hypothetical protein